MQGFWYDLEISFFFFANLLNSKKMSFLRSFSLIGWFSLQIKIKAKENLLFYNSEIKREVLGWQLFINSWLQNILKPCYPFLCSKTDIQRSNQGPLYWSRMVWWLKYASTLRRASQTTGSVSVHPYDRLWVTKPVLWTGLPNRYRRINHVCYMCMSTFTNIFFSETTGLIEANFHVEIPSDGGMKVCSNGSGRMTKMAAMPIYGKTL